MADNWSDWYSGSMAPPLSLPGGGYAPAPSSVPQMTPEQIYEGIYGESLSSGLSSRSAKSVPINPSTGMPYATTASAKMSGGPGIGYGAQGTVRYSQPVYQPNGTTVALKDQSRLPAVPAGLPLNTPSATGRAQLGAGGFGSGALDASMPAPAVIKLAFDPMSDVSGQNMANSAGKPVQGKSGKTYYPSNTPAKGVRAPYDPKAADKYTSLSGKDTRGPLSKLLGLKTSGLGGLLGGLFGGMQQRQGLGALLGMVPGVGAASPVSNIVGGSPVYSNGVANPSYRDYGSTTPGSGSFTDSLGGVYHDRNLR